MKTKIMVQMAVVLFGLVTTLGCATSGGATAKAPAASGDQAAITKTLGEWGSALGAKNLDQILAFYSDSFRDDEGRDKAAVKEMLEGVISAGYLDGAKIDLDGAQYSVNGEEAVVSPITLSGDMGSISVAISLKKEAGGWKISGSSQA